MREPGESDADTLLREIDEELQAVIETSTMVHFGTYETPDGHGGVEFRMICYTAEYRAALVPSREIAEMAWPRYAERDKVSRVDRMVFEALHVRGQLL
jgi:8-oxo-dGTP diphosphatase